MLNIQNKEANEILDESKDKGARYKETKEIEKNDNDQTKKKINGLAICIAVAVFFTLYVLGVVILVVQMVDFFLLFLYLISPIILTFVGLISYALYKLIKNSKGNPNVFIPLIRTCCNNFGLLF